MINHLGNEDHQRVHRKRVCREDYRAVVLGEYASKFKADWYSSFKHIHRYEPPNVYFNYFTQHGYRVRLSNATPLSKEELRTIKDALVSLVVEVPSILE